jgi:hypothetical protein
LERYYALLERARADLAARRLFRREELGLMVDACNGTHFEAWSVPLLSVTVQDSIALDGLDAKWGVDGAALVGKLAALDPASTFALVDAIERHWQRVAAGEQPDIEALLS